MSALRNNKANTAFALAQMHYEKSCQLKSEAARIINALLYSW
jgi:hypothetical protein